MSWSDFDAASALERDVLQRALPLVPTASDGSARVVIDVAADRADVAIGVTDVLGATPSSCIELLAIRPLLVGAAWKTLDLLLEEALLQGGFTPSSNRGWTIDSKAKRARAGDAKPTAIGMQAWRALMRTFAWTVDIRHSLVHRRAHTTPSGELVAVDRAGNAVGSLTVEEQEALARAALRAAELVIGATVDNRVEADLVRQLGVLSRLHAEKLPTVSLPDSLPEVVVILDPGPTDPRRYVLDVPWLRSRMPFSGVRHADLVVEFRDRPGQTLRGRLESGPDQAESIDPDRPPGWLSG